MTRLAYIVLRGIAASLVLHAVHSVLGVFHLLYQHFAFLLLLLELLKLLNLLALELLHVLQPLLFELLAVVDQLVTAFLQLTLHLHFSKFILLLFLARFLSEANDSLDFLGLHLVLNLHLPLLRL